MTKLLKRISYIFIVFIVLYLVLIMATGNSIKSMFISPDKPVFEQGTLVIQTQDGNAHGFTIEIAKTRKALLLGLMNRTTLEENAGMLLLFDRLETIGLWMKNTHIPLDMICIDENGKIVEIIENTIPLSTDSIMVHPSTRSVLEINAGLAKKLNVTIGDTVVYNFN